MNSAFFLYFYRNLFIAHVVMVVYILRQCIKVRPTFVIINILLCMTPEKRSNRDTRRVGLYRFVGIMLKVLVTL